MILPSEIAKNFRILLFDYVKEETLGYCNNLSNITHCTQVINNGSRCHQLTLYDCFPSDKLLSLCKDSEKKDPNIPLLQIRVLSKSGLVVGDYSFSVDFFVNSNITDEENDLYDITLEGLFAGPIQESEIILWDQIINESYPPKNSWVDDSIYKKRAKLNISRLYFCSDAVKEIPIEDGSSYEIDGFFIRDIPSFYLSIAEAIRGPFGYFGTCIQSFMDCIGGVNVENGTFTLIWKNSIYSREYLDKYSTLVENFEDLRSSIICLDHEEKASNILDDPQHLFCNESFFDEVCDVLVNYGVNLELK